MQTDFETMGGTYTSEGDYLLHNIDVPDSPQIGIWGEAQVSADEPKGTPHSYAAG